MRTSNSGATWLLTLAAGILVAGLAALAALLPMIKNVPGAAVVGWLMLGAGVAELGAALIRRGIEKGTGTAATVAGAMTALAGLALILNPDMHVVPLSYLVLAWLFIRAVTILAAVPQARFSSKSWLVAAGLADFVLGIVLLSGLPIAHLVVSLFGPTREIIASFSWVLAASFVVTGISLIALALLDRREAVPADVA